MDPSREKDAATRGEVAQRPPDGLKNIAEIEGLYLGFDALKLHFPASHSTKSGRSESVPPTCAAYLRA
jgi:hypothetical protein